MSMPDPSQDTLDAPASGLCAMTNSSPSWWALAAANNLPSLSEFDLRDLLMEWSDLPAWAALGVADEMRKDFDPRGRWEIARILDERFHGFAGNEQGPPKKALQRADLRNDT